MSSGDLLRIHPTELKFPFELKKQSSCSLQLTTRSDQYVAFKVKTTNPKKYCVRPNSGIIAPGTTFKLQFNKEAGKVVEEFKLRVIYIPANPPSPVPEGSEEGSPPRASALDNGNSNASLFDAESRSSDELKDKTSEAWMISKLTAEKTSAVQQNQKLQQELELLRSEINKSRAHGFSFLFVLAIAFLGVLIGYLFN